MNWGDVGVNYVQIPNRKNHYAGDDGSIWSHCYNKIIKRKLYLTPKNRLTVSFHKKNVFVHRLILESFIGPCPEGMECCHNNGISTDNRLCNLRWDTKINNSADLYNNNQEVGIRGKNNKSVKLTKDQVLEILLYLDKKDSQINIAKKFNISRSTINQIKRGYSWSWLTGIKPKHSGA